MEPIKITPGNEQAIIDALKAVNGTATAHTFTTYGEIEDEAKIAETEAKATKLTQAALIGAKWLGTSGFMVAKEYEKKARDRIATNVLLEKKKAGWYLIAVSKVKIGREGGGGWLHLTAEQMDKATRIFQNRYRAA